MLQLNYATLALADMRKTRKCMYVICLMYMYVLHLHVYVWMCTKICTHMLLHLCTLVRARMHTCNVDVRML